LDERSIFKKEEGVKKPEEKGEEGTENVIGKNWE
jgi:hypothetical protein